MKNILGTRTEISSFFCQHVCLFVYPLLYLVFQSLLVQGFVLFFLFPISLFNVTHFIKYLEYTKKKLPIVLGGSSSYKKKQKPYGVSNLMPYNMAYSCIAYSSLTFSFKSLNFYAFISKFYYLESILPCGVLQSLERFPCP